jgi:hypothetical protein
MNDLRDTFDRIHGAPEAPRGHPIVAIVFVVLFAVCVMGALWVTP